MKLNERKTGKNSRSRNGDGYIRERNNGSWELQYKIDGKSHSIYGKSKKEVQDKYTKLKYHISTGSITQYDKIKYSVWFVTWLEDYKRKELKPKTYESYYEMADLYILNSNIANMNIQDITVSHLQNYINKLENANLSPRTIQYVKNIINASFTQAMKNGIISQNNVKGVVIPKMVKPKTRALTIEEQQKFLKELDGNRYKFLYYFALNTGLRTSEILGLQWNHIDFNKKVFHVEQGLQYIHTRDTKKSQKIVGKPKTAMSTRTIPLVDEMIMNLLKHKELQIKEMNIADDLWLGYKGKQFDKNFVFTTDKGNFVLPSTLRHLINRTIDKINSKEIESCTDANDIILIEHFGMHTLRHTFATRALESGVEMKGIQDILGHTTISTTMDLYAHLLPDTKKKYMEQLIDVAPFHY